MLGPMMPVVASCDVIRERSDLGTWLLYCPKVGSSPEARNTSSPRPTGPGPSSYPPPVHSPLSVCFEARNCKPRSYISRTSRGTTSPNFAPGTGDCARQAVPERPARSGRAIAMIPRVKSMAGVLSRLRLLSGLRYRHLLLDVRGRCEHLCWKLPGHGSPPRWMNHLEGSKKPLVSKELLHLHPSHLIQLAIEQGPLPVLEQRLELGLGNLAGLVHHEAVIVLSKPGRGLGLAHDQFHEFATLFVTEPDRLVQLRHDQLDLGSIAEPVLVLDALLVPRVFLFAEDPPDGLGVDRSIAEQP